MATSASSSALIARPLKRLSALKARIGVGAAMTGMRPIVELMFTDFLPLAMEQLINQAAKMHYMTAGQAKVPMVLRATLGTGRGAAAQHSQSLHALVAHIPGLKVVMPSTPYDAKGLLKAAIRDDNPVIFLEHKMCYNTIKGPVPTQEYLLPLGVADVKREGQDVTLVAISRMVHVALAAAETLARDGISAEVVDPRTIRPLDKATILKSAIKTGRAVVIDEGHLSYGVTAEIAALIADDAFDYLDAPVKRVAARTIMVITRHTARLPYSVFRKPASEGSTSCSTSKYHCSSFMKRAFTNTDFP